MSNVSSPTLIIDADMLLFKVTSVTEHAVHWGDDLWILGGNKAEAIDLIELQIKNLGERFDTDKMIFCITGPENYRKDIDPEYKAHRKSTRKPLLYPQLKEYLIKKYHTVVEKCLEADDLCGIYATDPATGPCVIVSEDKDMLTLPAAVFRGGEVVDVDPESAWRSWMIQTLTGDITDGYTGCPGFGPVKAARALGDHPTWQDVVKCYEKAGLSEADALRNARLARILHHGDYDFANQKVKLWEPTA